MISVLLMPMSLGMRVGSLVALCALAAFAVEAEAAVESLTPTALVSDAGRGETTIATPKVIPPPTCRPAAVVRPFFITTIEKVKQGAKASVVQEAVKEAEGKMETKMAAIMKAQRAQWMAQTKLMKRELIARMSLQCPFPTLSPRRPHHASARAHHTRIVLLSCASC